VKKKASASEKRRKKYWEKGGSKNEALTFFQPVKGERGKTGIWDNSHRKGRYFQQEKKKETGGKGTKNPGEEVLHRTR